MHARPPIRRRPGPQRGFTLIEMMVVVAIIGILAALALPSLQAKIIRGQVAEGLQLAAIAKAPIAAAWSRSHTLPADNAAAGLPAPDRIVGNEVGSLTVENGAIQLRFGNRANAAINGKVLSLRPAVVEDAPVVPVAWVCGYASAPTPMTVRGVNRTDVPERFLPASCRSG